MGGCSGFAVILSIMSKKNDFDFDLSFVMKSVSTIGSDARSLKVYLRFITISYLSSSSSTIAISANRSSSSSMYTSSTNSLDMISRSFAYLALSYCIISPVAYSTLNT